VVAVWFKSVLAVTETEGELGFVDVLFYVFGKKELLIVLGTGY